MYYCLIFGCLTLKQSYVIVVYDDIFRLILIKIVSFIKLTYLFFAFQFDEKQGSVESILVQLIIAYSNYLFLSIYCSFIIFIISIITSKLTKLT